MYGILIREGKTTGDIKNIGDFVQSIAQKQFIKDKFLQIVIVETKKKFVRFYMDLIYIVSTIW